MKLLTQGPPRNVQNELNAKSAGELDGACDRVFGAWSKWLKREHRERPTLVREEAVAVLESLGLVERDGDGGLRLHAAAARYSARVQVSEAPGDGRDDCDDPEDQEAAL